MVVIEIKHSVECNNQIVDNLPKYIGSNSRSGLSLIVYPTEQFHHIGSHIESF